MKNTVRSLLEIIKILMKEDLYHPIYNSINIEKLGKKNSGKNRSKNFSRRVLKRDNYTCQKCGATDTAHLTAHHIIPVSIVPELKSDISNGVTLCLSCHRKEHNHNPPDIEKRTKRRKSKLARIEKLIDDVIKYNPGCSRSDARRVI